MAQGVNDPDYLCEGAGSLPGLVQWVKDPAWLQLWCRSQLWLRFSPSPGNFHMPLGWPKKKKKKKKKERKARTYRIGAEWVWG